MPLLHHWEPDSNSHAAIWKIEEPEAWFVERTGLCTVARHEKKRLEFLAARFLLQYLKPDFPLHTIMPDAADKPRIPGNSYFFSLSHSFPYVTAVINTQAECGIDIQVWHHKMHVLQHKFLAPEEQVFFQDNPQLITLAWCAKEAAYKWQGKRGVDFIAHLPIQHYVQLSETHMLDISLLLLPRPTTVRATGFLSSDFAFSIIANKY